MDSAHTTLSSQRHSPHQTCNTAHIYSAKLVPKYEHNHMNQAQSCSSGITVHQCMLLGHGKVELSISKINIFFLFIAQPNFRKVSFQSIEVDVPLLNRKRGLILNRTQIRF